MGVVETGHGGNQPLGARVVPLECRCNASGSERLCPFEIGKCTRGSPGCRSDGYTECKKEMFLGPKNGTTCSGWNSIGEQKTGEMDCNHPSTVTGYAGPTGNACSGFTHGLKQVKGVIRCD